MNNSSLINRISSNKIIAIARGITSDKAVKLAKALYDGGIEVLEFPFNIMDINSTATDEAIKAVSDAMGDKMIIGCGTCSYPELVDRTYKAGGKIVVSADMNTAVIKRTKELGMISIPGIGTATEAMTAIRAGADFVKVFPAANLGADYIKAIKTPLYNIKFMAVGGIDLENMGDFLKNGCVGVGIGGSLVKNAWVENEEFDKITELAAKYAEMAKAF